MNNKLKKLYNQGGLLKALLQDPKQREMAEDILNKAEDGMSVKRYRNGGSNPERDRRIREQFDAQTQRMADDAVGGIEAVMARETQKDKIKRRGDFDPSYKISEDYVDINEYVRRRGLPPEAKQIMEEAKEILNTPVTYFNTAKDNENKFKGKVREAQQAIYRAADKEFNSPAGYGDEEREYASGMGRGDTDIDFFLTYSDKYKDAPFNIENFPGGGVRLKHPTMGMQFYEAKGYEDGGKAKTYRSGGMMYENGGETDPPYEMLSEATVVADKPSGYMSKLFVKEGMSGDDYSRERYNLGRELADKIMQQGMASPVSNKVVSALLGDQVELDSMERKQLGYLRDKGFSSGLTDLQLQRGLLESGFVDKKTGSRLTEEAIKAAQSRGLKLTPDEGGLNATYFFQ